MNTSVITTAATILHNEWRAPRLLANGTYEPRIKPDGMGGNVDIANTDYAELPAKWQYENLAAATYAVTIIEQLNIPSDASAHMEFLAALVHLNWLSRNSEWAPASQTVRYSRLSESDKELDRVVVRAALTALGR